MSQFVDRLSRYRLSWITTIVAPLMPAFETLPSDWIRGICLAVSVVSGTYAIHGTWSKTRVTISVGLMLAGLALLAFFGARSLEKAPVFISPDATSLRSLTILPQSGLSGTIDLRVLNRSDEVYYQIWVRIQIEPSVVEPKLIDVDFPSLKQTDGLDAQVNYICMRGTSEEWGAGFLCLLKELSPGEQFIIRLSSSQDFGQLTDEQVGGLTATVTHFNRKPPRTHLSRPGATPGASLEVPVQEPFSPSQWIVFCTTVTQPPPPPVVCTPNSRKRP